MWFRDTFTKLKEAAEQSKEDEFDTILTQFATDWREFVIDRPNVRRYMSAYINNFLVEGEVYSIGKYQAIVAGKQIGPTKYIFIRGDKAIGFTPLKKFRIPGGGEVPF